MAHSTIDGIVVPVRWEESDQGVVGPMPLPAQAHVTSYFNQPEASGFDPMGVLPYDLPRRPGIPAPGDWAPRRRLNNLLAHEGVDRCFCGAKYWENDQCVDCGLHISVVRREQTPLTHINGQPVYA